MQISPENEKTVREVASDLGYDLRTMNGRDIQDVAQGCLERIGVKNGPDGYPDQNEVEVEFQGWCDDVSVVVQIER